MVWWDERSVHSMVRSGSGQPGSRAAFLAAAEAGCSSTPTPAEAVPVSSLLAQPADTSSSRLQAAVPQQGIVPLLATVDLDCPYIRQLVVEAFGARPAWAARVLAGQGEEVCEEARRSLFHWAEYERIDWAHVQEGHQVASAYCIRKGLIRKAHLAHNLRKWAAKVPAGRLAGAVPETWVLQLDDVEYFEEAMCDVPEVRDMPDGSALWIAKPSITNQALGVCIFDRVATLRAAIEQAEDLREWVLQRYIERPLLVAGRKFHLRAYALCVGSLRVYVYSEVLALFAARPYDSALADLADLGAHLTNTCHAERAAGGAGGGAPARGEADLVRLLSELPQALAAEGMELAEAQRRVAQANDDVQAVIGECLQAVSGELTFFTLPNCWELFGFDLLLDQDWHLWLLEANPEPDLAQTGERLRPVIRGVVDGILSLTADRLAADLAQQQSACSQASSAASAQMCDEAQAAGPEAPCGSSRQQHSQAWTPGGGSDRGQGGLCHGTHGSGQENLDGINAQERTQEMLGRWVLVYESKQGARSLEASGLRLT